MLALTIAGCGSRGGDEPPATPAPPAAPAGEPAASQPGASAPYTARGNEPGWLVTLTSDRLAVDADYGSLKLEGLTPAPEVTADGFRYRLRADGHDVVVTVSRTLCHDGMSGMSFPDSVTLAIDDRTLRGCGGDPASLLQGTWTVESIGETTVPDGTAVTLVFKGAQLGGSTGCNNYTTSYQLTGEGLTTGHVASTMRACPDAQMAIERTFLDFLHTIHRHDVRDSRTLVLYGEGERTIVAHR
ncbi:MAG: META domain-containing protein [Vicinamibacterales bacterium]